MEQLDWEEAREKQCAWDEKCEAAVPCPGAKEKQRGRQQMLLHLCLSIFTICLNGQSHLPSCFLQGGGSSTLLVALMEAQAGTKAMCGHGWPWALSNPL